MPDDIDRLGAELRAEVVRARREDAVGAGHHAPHAKRYGLTVEDGLSCIEPKGNGNYVRFEDYETLRRQYDATAEGYRAALSTAERDVKALREYVKASEHWSIEPHDQKERHAYFTKHPAFMAAVDPSRVPSGGEPRARTPESHD